MPKTWTKTTAFGYFGVTLANTRWGWSGISADKSTVAVVLWQDAVKGEGGALTYDDTEDPDAAWRKRPGAVERMEILKYCRDHLDGRFKAVIAIAADVTADPREIMRCFPQEGADWQLDESDDNGGFRAHVGR